MKRKHAVFLSVSVIVPALAFYFVVDSTREKGPISVKYSFAPGTRVPSIVYADIRTVRSVKRADSGRLVKVETKYREKMTYVTWCFGSSDSLSRVARERHSTDMNLLSRTVDGRDVAGESYLPAPGFDFHLFDSRGVDLLKDRLGEGVYDLVRAAFDVRILPAGEVRAGDAYSWSASYGKIACDMKGRFIGSAFLGDSDVLCFENILEIYRPLEGGKRDVVGTVDADVKITRDGRPVRVDGSFRFWTLDDDGNDFIYDEDFREIFGASESAPADMAKQFEALAAAYALIRAGDKTDAERSFKVFLVQFPESPLTAAVREIIDRKLEFQPR
jgi:hypothetical protein